MVTALGLLMDGLIRARRSLQEDSFLSLYISIPRRFSVQKGDVRAVENPISAIFDLAEEVNEQAPKIRKIIGYSRFFIAIWLFVDFVLLIVFAEASRLQLLPLTGILLITAVALRWSKGFPSKAFLMGIIFVDSLLISLVYGEAFIMGALLAALFVLGIIILNLMRDIRGFLNYYVLRHRAIKSVREEDPVVYIPQGKDAVDRLFKYLSERHPELRGQARQGYVESPAVLRGRSGLLYSFDACVVGRPSALWKPLGLGDTGYAIFIKAFTEAPTARDLAALKRGVEDVCQAEKVPPSRVIALWTAKEDESLSDEAYDFLTTEVVTFRHGGQEFNCSLELIMESPDGTYDFIPYVTESLYA